MQLTPGARLGKYTIESCIGAGGFGRVYRAIQSGPGGFCRPVAIKVLRPGPARSDSVQSFSREARTIALLQHRNIVQVFEFAAEGDQYYLVMEFIDGATVAALARSPLPLWLAVAIGQEVCRGLHYAHALCDELGQPLGIVHRDVKPTNILLGRQGDVKLTDFGLAKMSAVASDGITDAGVVKGTPAYMSPEQWRGEATGPASDVFALAAVLYELCTGVSFAMRSSRGAAGATDLEPPSAHATMAPAELDRLVLSALAAAPSGRPASAELLAGLQSVLAELAPPERLSRLSEDLGLWAERAAADRTALSPPPMPDDLGPHTVSRQVAPRPFAPIPVAATPTPDARRPHDELLQGETLVLPTAGSVVEPDTIEAEIPPAPESAVEPDTVETSVEDASANRQTARRGPRRRPWIAVALGSTALVALAGGLAWVIAVGGRTHATGLADARAPLADRASPRDAAPRADRPGTETAPDRSGVPRPDASPAQVDVSKAETRSRPRPPHRPKHPAPAAAPGHLSLNASPWARVVLDGKMIGTTPLFRREVRSGWHELRLVGANGRAIARRVHVRPGEHVRLGKIELAP